MIFFVIVEYILYVYPRSIATNLNVLVPCFNYDSRSDDFNFDVVTVLYMLALLMILYGIVYIEKRSNIRFDFYYYLQSGVVSPIGLHSKLIKRF